MKRLIYLICVFFICGSVYAQAERESIEVTVYNENLALVKERRVVNLNKGLNHIRLMEIPAQIDATSVRFYSLKDPQGTFVKEQNYEYDLASDAKLLHRYLDKEIEVITKEGTHYEGTLIAGVRQFIQSNTWWDYNRQKQETKSEIAYSYGNLVIAKDKEKGPISIVQLQDNIREIKLPGLLQELITRPTLAWEIVSDKKGKHEFQINYLTKGMSWRADYTALINPYDTKLDLGAWTTINNHSGATFPQARVKLMAGEIAQLDRQRGRQIKGYVYGKGEEGPTPETRQVFEYHLYALDEITDLKNNQTKQIKLLSADGVPVEKFYVYDGVQMTQDRSWYFHRRDQRDYGIQTNKKVMVFLEFINSQNNGLGMPLPKGKIRMYKLDEDKSLEFIGEDEIDHTPGNERVRMRVGGAFDIIGERKQTDFKVIESNHIYDESFEIVVRNHKKEDIEVRVVEHLYRWSDWEMRQTSDSFLKTDSRTIEFRVKVPADGEKKLAYTVRYKW